METSKDRKSRRHDFRIHGFAKGGFEPVREAFVANFARRRELGAACSIYVRGEKVVDLWGGVRDEETGAPWEEDTMAVVSSTTKGLTAMAVALAHSRGLLELDEKVATYWPEFAQAGKEAITIRQLMAHQAGLCALDRPPTFDEAADPARLAEILARQRPAWDPGTRQGYHAVTLGWYAAELLRRVDPRHRSLGRFFHEEIARPLGVEFSIGLPAEVPDSRIATIKVFGLREIVSDLPKMPLHASMRFLTPRSLTKRAFVTPVPTAKDERELRRRYLSIEGPGYNGVGTARGIAEAYGAFATGPGELGLRGESVEALIRPAPPPSGGPIDLILGLPVRFSLGCLKPFPGFPFGSSARAFGIPGVGGSIGYADPDTGSGFAYVPNRWTFWPLGDRRQIALWRAFQRCVAPEPPGRAQADGGKSVAL